jgi:hypothetical protein
LSSLPRLLVIDIFKMLFILGLGKDHSIRLPLLRTARVLQLAEKPLATLTLTTNVWEGAAGKHGC